MDHTPEPWSVVERKDSRGKPYVSIESGQVPVVSSDSVLAASEETIPIVSIEDADRIVACVNFCRGIPTGRLFDLANTADRINSRLALEELMKRDTKNGCQDRGIKCTASNTPS